MYVSASGSFRVQYVSPPWMVSADDGSTLELRIPAEVFGVALDGSPPSHGLQIGHADAAGELATLIEKATDNGIPDTATDTLPDGLATDGFTTEGFATDGLPTGGELPGGLTGEIPEDILEEEGIPEYLIGIDLSNHRDVAFAELNHLILGESAQLHNGLQAFTTAGGQQGVVYNVVLDPGVFVRAFYFATESSAVRAAFISPFDLETEDIDIMAGSILTNDPETRE